MKFKEDSRIKIDVYLFPEYKEKFSFASNVIVTIKSTHFTFAARTNDIHDGFINPYD